MRPYAVRMDLSLTSTLWFALLCRLTLRLWRSGLTVFLKGGIRTQTELYSLHSTSSTVSTCTRALTLALLRRWARPRPQTGVQSQEAICWHALWRLDHMLQLWRPEHLRAHRLHETAAARSPDPDGLTRWRKHLHIRRIFLDFYLWHQWARERSAAVARAAVQYCTVNCSSLVNMWPT